MFHARLRRWLAGSLLWGMLAGASAAQADNLPATVSWVGNTYGGGKSWVLQDVQDISVDDAGSLFTNIFWDEAGGNVQEYKEGKLARIAYHTMIGLEWFFSNLPEAEHRKTRRYNLNSKGPVEEMPDRQAMLEDLAWMTSRIREWFAEWAQETAAGTDRPFRLKKTLYFLRHTQHHIGEFCATARLLEQERPAWGFPPSVPESIRNNP
jgi:hypothetical protein